MAVANLQQDVKKKKRQQAHYLQLLLSLSQKEKQTFCVYCLCSALKLFCGCVFLLKCYFLICVFVFYFDKMCGLCFCFCCKLLYIYIYIFFFLSAVVCCCFYFNFCIWCVYKKQTRQS